MTIHFDELSFNSTLEKSLFKLLAKEGSFSVTTGLAVLEVPVMDFILSHTPLGLFALEGASKCCLCVNLAFLNVVLSSFSVSLSDIKSLVLNATFLVFLVFLMSFVTYDLLLG